MSRQSELSDGIEEIFKKYKEALQKDPSIDFRNFASYDVLHYLHSQGCVISTPDENGDRWIESILEDNGKET